MRIRTPCCGRGVDGSQKPEQGEACAERALVCSEKLPPALTCEVTFVIYITQNTFLPLYVFFVFYSLGAATQLPNKHMETYS